MNEKDLMTEVAKSIFPEEGSFQALVEIHDHTPDHVKISVKGIPLGSLGMILCEIITSLREKFKKDLSEDDYEMFRESIRVGVHIGLTEEEILEAEFNKFSRSGGDK